MSDHEVNRRIVRTNADGNRSTRTRVAVDAGGNDIATLVEGPNRNGTLFEAEVRWIRDEKGDSADAHFEHPRG